MTHKVMSKGKAVAYISWLGNYLYISSRWNDLPRIISSEEVDDEMYNEIIKSLTDDEIRDHPINVPGIDFHNVEDDEQKFCLTFFGRKDENWGPTILMDTNNHGNICFYAKVSEIIKIPDAFAKSFEKQKKVSKISVPIEDTSLAKRCRFVFEENNVITEAGRLYFSNDNTLLFVMNEVYGTFIVNKRALITNPIEFNKLAHRLIEKPITFMFKAFYENGGVDVIVKITYHQTNNKIEVMDREGHIIYHSVFVNTEL